jgi:hypothetical protein
MKPSKELQARFDKLALKYTLNTIEDLRWIALKDYLDEQAEKKEKIYQRQIQRFLEGKLPSEPNPYNEESEFDAIKNDIKKQAIKEFADKIMENRYYLLDDIFIKKEDIKEVLKDYNIKL